MSQTCSVHPSPSQAINSLSSPRLAPEVRSLFLRGFRGVRGAKSSSSRNENISPCQSFVGFPELMYIVSVPFDFEIVQKVFRDIEITREYSVCKLVCKKHVILRTVRVPYRRILNTGVPEFCRFLGDNLIDICTFDIVLTVVIENAGHGLPVTPCGDSGCGCVCCNLVLHYSVYYESEVHSAFVVLPDKDWFFRGSALCALYPFSIFVGS